MILGRVFFYTS